MRQIYMNMIKEDCKQKLGKTTVLSPAHVQQIHHVRLILTDPPESEKKKRGTSDTRRLSSRIWPVPVLNSYFGTCAGCSNLTCNETITSQLVIDSYSDEFLECMKVFSWHIFDRWKSLNEKKVIEQWLTTFWFPAPGYVTCEKISESD